MPNCCCFIFSLKFFLFVRASDRDIHNILPWIGKSTKEHQMGKLITRLDKFYPYSERERGWRHMVFVLRCFFFCFCCVTTSCQCVAMAKKTHHWFNRLGWLKTPTILRPNSHSYASDYERLEDLHWKFSVMIWRKSTIVIDRKKVTCTTFANNLVSFKLYIHFWKNEINRIPNSTLFSLRFAKIKLKLEAPRSRTHTTITNYYNLRLYFF